MASEFDFTDTALELCARKGCCHYRGEHSGPVGICMAPGRMADGVAVPGTTCMCDGMVSIAEQLAATRTSDGHWLSRQQIAQHGKDRYPTIEKQLKKVADELMELAIEIGRGSGIRIGVRHEYADVGLALYALGDKLGLDLIEVMRELVENDTRRF